MTWRWWNRKPTRRKAEPSVTLTGRDIAILFAGGMIIAALSVVLGALID